MNDKYSERPWGKWEMLDEGTGYWVKKITVNPGGKLSLQKHSKREEIWTIVSGAGVVTVDDKVMEVFAPQVVLITFEAIHRIENTAKEPLVFIEVAVGEPDEADIIRLEDQYGR